MTGEKGVGWVGRGVTDWWGVGRPPLDPSTVPQGERPLAAGRIPDRGREVTGGPWVGGEGCAKAWGRDSLWGEESCLY